MNRLILGDVRETVKTLADGSVHCIITSPPYFGLRDYGVAGQMGLEQTPEQFVVGLVELLRECRRVLRDDGTLWLNLGDSYAGSGKCVWNVPDDRKSKVKETYRPSVDPSKSKRIERGSGRWGGGDNKVPGLPAKNLIGVPWRVALALQADGWILRQDIIWHKPNPMPESVSDRVVKAHEYIFLLSKSPRYYFDHRAIQEPANYAPSNGRNKHEAAKGSFKGVRPQQRDERVEQAFRAIREMRNKRSVWTVTPASFKEAHFATFPPALIEPCVLAGCPEGGVVFDPFFGAGTTGLVAQQHGRSWIGCELNPTYVNIARRRLGMPPDLTALLGELGQRIAENVASR